MSVCKQQTPFSLLCSQPRLSRVPEALPLSLSLSFVSLFLSLTGVMATGRRRACTVPGLKLGTHPWRLPPSGSQESWQQAPPPPHVPASATSSAGGVIGLPSPRALPAGTARARGRAQRFPHPLPPLPGHSQAWGFSIGLERGGSQGGYPDNKEIGSQLGLRWDGLCFLKVPGPSCPARVWSSLFHPILFPPSFLLAREHCLG